jgi:galactose-1-phosphate uridylyltransferase
LGKEKRFEEIVENAVGVVERRKNKMIKARDKKIKGHAKEIAKVRKYYGATTKDNLNKMLKKERDSHERTLYKATRIYGALKPFILKLKVIDINNLKTSEDLLPLMVDVGEMKDILKAFDKMGDL